MAVAMAAICLEDVFGTGLHLDWPCGAGNCVEAIADYWTRDGINPGLRRLDIIIGHDDDSPSSLADACVARRRKAAARFADQPHSRQRFYYRRRQARFRVIVDDDEFQPQARLLPSETAERGKEC